MMFKYTNNNRINEMIAKVVEQGWEVRPGKGHVKVCPPDKAFSCVTIASTPGDHRAEKNVRAEFRRRGAVI
jgi:hypothetical protein